ncbi:VWA domain-containing protein [Sphaerisporangium perillae]|uniref:VWA domain-containing protein n=1 Tax=Sphaerisporangium perillae TaxID=2935860 RepID=UPI00200E90AE|nr:VWA domain-containing protein [Sphaerisporangium perillae]
MSSSHSRTPAPLLRSVDRAAFAVRLRRRGVPVGFTGIEDLVRALAVCPPDSLPRLYWTARISLVRQRSDIGVFDAVFAAVFGAVPPELGPHARRGPRRTAAGGDDDAFASMPAPSAAEQHGGGLPWMTLPPAVAGAEDAGDALTVPERLPSDLAGSADVPFEQLDAREMAMLGKWLEAAVAGWPTRRSRRHRVDPQGRRITLRATLERSRRTGWEPIDLIRVRAVDRPRPVVMLCGPSTWPSGRNRETWTSRWSAARSSTTR